MTDQRQGLPLLGFFRREAASHHRLYAEQFKEIGGDPDGTDVLAFRLSGEHHRHRVEECHIGKALALASPLFGAQVCRAAFPDALARNLAPQHCQPVRGSIGKRLEEHGIQHAEHRGIGADREREYGDGADGKAGAFAQGSQGVAYVAPHGFDECERATVTVGFFHRLDASKAAQGGVARVGWIHAGFEVVLNLHFEVKANLIVQLALQPMALRTGHAGARQIRQAGSCLVPSRRFAGRTQGRLRWWRTYASNRRFPWRAAFVRSR